MISPVIPRSADVHLFSRGWTRGRCLRRSLDEVSLTRNRGRAKDIQGCQNKNHWCCDNISHTYVLYRIPKKLESIPVYRIPLVFVKHVLTPRRSVAHFGKKNVKWPCFEFRCPFQRNGSGGSSSRSFSVPFYLEVC